MIGIVQRSNGYASDEVPSPGAPATSSSSLKSQTQFGWFHKGRRVLHSKPQNTKRPPRPVRTDSSGKRIDNEKQHHIAFSDANHVIEVECWKDLNKESWKKKCQVCAIF